MTILGTEGTGDLLFRGFLRIGSHLVALIGEKNGLSLSRVLLSVISLYTV